MWRVCLWKHYPVTIFFVIKYDVIRKKWQFNLSAKYVKLTCMPKSIFCDYCLVWFHLKCTNLKQELSLKKRSTTKHNYYILLRTVFHWNNSIFGLVLYSRFHRLLCLVCVAVEVASSGRASFRNLDVRLYNWTQFFSSYSWIAFCNSLKDVGGKHWRPRS
jgi:hypothetical protein